MLFKVKQFAKRLIMSIRLNELFCLLTAKSEKLELTDNDLNEAYNLLESVYPSHFQDSCICSNNIEKKVDLHIIIPAYNVEKHIKKCLDSVVLPEKRYTCHITVVNDGSTDNTLSIIEKYKDYPEVEIINQSNKGLSGARNAALKNIVGDYIFFLDSDDYIDMKETEALIDIAREKNADIVCGSVSTIDMNNNVYLTARFHPGRLEVESTQKRESGMGYPWGKIYKAELFSDLCFPKNYWFEDSIITQIVLYKAKNVYKSDKIVYFYRTNPSSITHQSRGNVKAIDSLYITRQLYNDRKLLGFKNTDSYYEYILRMVRLTYLRTNQLDENIQKAIFIVTCDFILSEFKGFSTKVRSKKLLEKAIKTKDYGLYKSVCKYVK